MAKSKTIYTIKINNWEKYNPKEVANRSWVALSTHIFVEPGFAEMNPSNKLWWISLLCECARQNKGGGVFDLWVDVHTTLYGSRGVRCLDLALTLYSAHQWIQILSQNEDPIQTDRHTHIQESEKFCSSPSLGNGEIKPASRGDDELSGQVSKPIPDETIFSRGLIILWNEAFPDFPVRSISKQRAQLARDAFKENPDLASWKEIFKKVKLNSFLTGGSKSGWRADFDWVMTKGNWARIADGAFDSNGKVDNRKIRMLEP